MKKYRFLDERNFRYFCQGLTLDAKDMSVLDEALRGLDAQEKLPSRIVAHNNPNGFGPPFRVSGGQVIINLEKRWSAQKGFLSMAAALRHKDIAEGAPALHVALRSISLDIPQRVEIPLRYVLKGLPKIEETFMVYLHVLRMESGENFVYYGITKRGWMKRFNEHMSGALRERSRLLFHQALREGIQGRMIQLHGASSVALEDDEKPTKIMVGNHHVVCGAGLNEQQALETEEYLVQKYSFGSPVGLNMIPGGKAGISYLHRLRIASTDRSLVIDQDRERVLEAYLRRNPAKGLPNLLIAKHWKNDDYAARVICSGPSRLTVEQVQHIRASALVGKDAEAICLEVGARDRRQVQRVLNRKTYARIRS